MKTPKPVNYCNTQITQASSKTPKKPSRHFSSTLTHKKFFFFSLPRCWKLNFIPRICFCCGFYAVLTAHIRSRLSPPSFMQRWRKSYKSPKGLVPLITMIFCVGFHFLSYFCFRSLESRWPQKTDFTTCKSLDFRGFNDDVPRKRISGSWAHDSFVKVTWWLFITRITPQNSSISFRLNSQSWTHMRAFFKIRK